MNAADVARNESFWFQIQQAFDVDRSIINLNNGGVHPAPRVVMQAVKRYLDFANGCPTYNMWEVLRPRKELVRKEIADTFGCSPEEIAITRNVTESLQTALLGIPLQSGDEILTTAHDYPSMKSALRQRERRDGIRVRMFSYHCPPGSLKVLADLFERNVTERTRLILVSHITFTTGQIFPVRQVCQMAREKSINVVVDGAHAFGQFDYKQRDLDCDIYGANLHKWMMAPIGTGFLYVRKDKIKDIWPLFPARDPLGDDIKKFEHMGTRPEYLECAIGEAIAFHHGIGAKNKEERLRYLREYWARQLEKLPEVRILTPYEAGQSCGIGTFTIEGVEMKRLSEVLFEKHGIHTATVSFPGVDPEAESVSGIRVTPSIYTTLRELDLFVEAVSDCVKKGLPN